MSILENILERKAFIIALLIAVFMGGILSYQGLGKLEDPEIPVKSAVIMTPYPGASASEVELEVTDLLEKAILKLENIDFIESRSSDGMSEITVNIDGSVPTSDMPQLYDHLRRKINDVKGNLPASAHDPIVVDDFGDVYGIFVSISADGYSYKELDEYVEFLKREFLALDGIKRIEIYGQQMETFDVVFSNDKFAQLGINPMLIAQALGDESSLVDAGDVVIGSDRVRMSVGEKYKSIEDVENLLVQVPGGGSFLLGDIAKVERSFYTPMMNKFKHNGVQAMSLAIAMDEGVNVIKIGEIFENKVEELSADLPVGINIDKVFFQPDRVAESIKGFMVNLIESVLIVIVVLLFAMGMRSGLLISSGLVFTILGTFIIMKMMGIELQRVTLSAIIVAMGMLVDNSIVVADGILMDLKKGVESKKAFVNTAIRTSMPLLGATIIAILAFMPLGFSPGMAGEFLKSLFYVLAISLFLSWVFAMIQTPFMAKFFYKKNVSAGASDEADLYNNGLYRWFKGVIRKLLWHKTAFAALSGLGIVVSIWSFGFVKQEFFPNLDYNQYVIEYWLPQGGNIYQVEEDLDEIQKEISTWDNIESVTTSIGQTPARYSLLRPMNTLNSNYGEFIIDASDFPTSQTTSARILEYLSKEYPQALARARTYSPIFSEYLMEAKFSGPDPAVLRSLAEEAKVVMRANPNTTGVTDNWKNKAKVLTPAYSPDQARLLDISRSQVANSLAMASNGMPIGVIHEGSSSLPVMLKMEEPIGEDVEHLSSVPVWGNGMTSTPLSQITDSIYLKWDNQTIRRYDGQRAIKAQCDPKPGITPPELFEQIHEDIEAIQLPHGYSMEWLGDHKSSTEAQEDLFNLLPLALGLMFLILIMIFNNFKQPLIIMGVVPMAITGVAIGFHLMNATFGFIGIIGTLGLIGMMIKNAIVLLDEINDQLKNGASQLDAIVNSAVSRMRPVMMASLTTILGMIPLLFDVMFKGMAISIMYGLLVGSLVTLLVVPIMYAIIYKVDTRSLKEIKE
ncbi:efflux RND transporter permease subunit [Saccharicrinis aurantiacus]|uniref:efflux RND transporter permease subunit n=1 Tax=Saccharicrinis aurantiacus TaxID=1849719 RepID=UPI0024918924|nr:efflux RND transporter permease subunit [Saccharicrinis aurantiacus]